MRGQTRPPELRKSNQICLSLTIPDLRAALHFTTSTPGYITLSNHSHTTSEIPTSKALQSCSFKASGLSFTVGPHLPISMYWHSLWTSITQYSCSCARVWSLDYLPISPRSSYPIFIVCIPLSSTDILPILSPRRLYDHGPGRFRFDNFRSSATVCDLHLTFNTGLN